jgi:hypothetical protein
MQISPGAAVLGAGVYLWLTKTGAQWGSHIWSSAAPFILSPRSRDKRRRAMDALLLIIAWAAGIAGLFLVGDMIAADLANRRAERVAARAVEPERRRRHRR